MTDNATFRSFGSVLDDIMSKLQEPEQDEASERILRKHDRSQEQETEDEE